MKLPCLALLLLFAPHAARADDDLALMRGSWKPTAIELAGRPMPPAVLATISMKIEGANYDVVVQTEKGPSPDQGTLTLDPTTTPKGMTVTGVAGPNRGKVFPAIYELKDDTLRICYDLSGKERPTEFKTTTGTKLYLVVYERLKPN
ncbi:MAG TPA: TIGR03067 domain-containing protein [Lacunisphaera sp.]|nr:TIGR03067 domain-containing protein [Lacunisphaera sp.]